MGVMLMRLKQLFRIEYISISQLVTHRNNKSMIFVRGQMYLFVCLMVFNATFNNISVISWRSVLLVDENGVPGENHRLSQVTDKHFHITLHQVHLA
jgi:hypothetical protein